MDKPKMIVIGLDGVDWRLLNKFVKAGILPSFEEILKDGVSCRIISSIPPLTVPSWINAFTGVNPGKHGIFHFVKFLPSESMKINTLRDLKVDPVWRILSDYGKKVAIIRFPLGLPTYRDGIYVGGFLVPSIDKKSIRPAELIEILNKMNYPLASNFINQIIYQLKGEHEKALNYLLGIFEKRAKFMRYVMDTYKPDFIFNLFDTTDRLLHIYIDDEEMVVKFLKKVDNFIGEILKTLDENTYLIILSDHGFEKIDKYFFPNDFFAINGYLKISNLNRIFKTKFYLLERFPKYFIERLPRYMLEYLYKKMSGSSTYILDFKDHEMAKFSISHHIKINPRISKKYNWIREQIISKLNSLRDERGNKIVEAFKREEIYKGDCIKFAPDIILLVREGYTLSSAISGKIIRSRFIVGKVGDHVSLTAMQNAFFSVYHKNYSLKLKNKVASISDIAPTISYLLNMQVPKYMEGKKILLK